MPERGTTRRRRSSARGFGMVEFALIAPLAMLLLMGLVVLGVVVTDQVQLTNAIRDGARAAAVCGSNPTGITMLPDASATCSDAAVLAWITTQANGSHGGVATPTLNVYGNGTLVGHSLQSCQRGYTVEVITSFAQQLYVPLVGHWLGDNGGNTRTINAKAEATCEQ